METILILCRRELSEGEFMEFVLKEDGHQIPGPSLDLCIERGSAAVFLSIENYDAMEWGGFADVKPNVFKKVVILTMSRSNGTEVLTFEIATKIAHKWLGVVSWGGFADIEERYERWCQLNGISAKS